LLISKTKQKFHPIAHNNLLATLYTLELDLSE